MKNNKLKKNNTSKSFDFGYFRYSFIVKILEGIKVRKVLIVLCEERVKILRRIISHASFVIEQTKVSDKSDCWQS